MGFGKRTVCLLFTVLFCVSGSAYATERLSLATGGTAGSYYPIGSGIASIVMKNVPGIEITAESTGASVANLKMLREKKVELILGASNTSWGAYKGEPPFNDKPVTNIRGIACLYPEIFQFIVLKNSGMQSIPDLKGKKIAVGAPGSGTERTAKMILEAHGLTYNDVEEQFLNFGEAVTALKDRLIDCAIVGSGIPTSAVVDISTTLDIGLLKVDETVTKSFLKGVPYLSLIEIPADTYRGVTTGILTVASPAILSAEAGLGEATVYKITKAVFEHLGDLAAVHAQGKMITLKTALSAMSVPLHPGAEKYYREVGVLK